MWTEWWSKIKISKKNYQMNETVIRFSLAADKSLPEIYLDLQIMRADYLLKRKKEYKNFKKQEIQDIFIKKN